VTTGERGNCGSFREQFLTLGYTAWQGYLGHGRGMLIGEMTGDVTMENWSGTMMPFQIQYKAAIAIPSHLQSYHVPTDQTYRLLEAMQTYAPDQEILLALHGGDDFEVSWLRNLAIAPPECHRQVCNRWDEFNLDLESREDRDK
jgi:hypothetical protein